MVGCTWWRLDCTLQRQLLDEGSPNQKSAASVYAQGGNEHTLTADLIAMVSRERGRSCMVANDARHREGDGFRLVLTKDLYRGLSVLFEKVLSCVVGNLRQSTARYFISWDLQSSWTPYWENIALP